MPNPGIVLKGGEGLDTGRDVASRGWNIQNKPIVNRDHNSNIIAELKQQIQLLASELLLLRNSGGGNVGGVPSNGSSSAGALLSGTGAAAATQAGGGVLASSSAPNLLSARY